MSLGGAKQAASTVYLSTSRASGRRRGLSWALLLNAAANAKFALLDAERLGCAKLGSVAGAALYALLGVLARAR
jgi:hypothetical protein